MVNRYAIFESAGKIASQLGLEEAADYTPHYNAYPSLKLPVVSSRQPSILSFHYWGLSPEMAANKQVSPKLINVALSDILSRPVHQNNFIKKRCIIPANGLFVWKPIGKKKLIPTYIYPKKQNMLALAGLWEEYEDIRGKKHQVFSMITMPAARGMESLQPNLPVVVTADYYNKWLSNEQNAEKLVAMMENLDLSTVQSHPVTPRITENILNNASILQEVSPSDQFGNYTLFDFY